VNKKSTLTIDDCLIQFNLNSTGKQSIEFYFFYIPIVNHNAEFKPLNVNAFLFIFYNFYYLLH
jgi:hypothetical protein